jgi:hypothetical protein
VQSGRFDVPDRLFHSLHETWLSASGATNNLADVKVQLVPLFSLSLSLSSISPLLPFL